MKGPLITRTELRKRKEAEEQRTELERSEERYEALDTQEEEQELSNFYRKKREPALSQPLSKTRSGEQSKIRARSNKLTRAIILVAILLIIVMLIVLNL